MKSTLLLSLSLMLPINAMEMETPKDDQHAQLLAEASEHQTKERKSAFKKKVIKKIIATGLLTLLAGAGTVSSFSNLENAIEPIRLLPYAPVLPADNATCTYYQDAAFNKTDWQRCILGHDFIPTEYCNCGEIFCPLIVQKCQDPFKKKVYTNSAISFAAQITAGIAGTLGIWCTD